MKAGTSLPERSRSIAGEVWDWLIARLRTFVRITDTGLLYGYRAFRKVTVDWLEPYIRVAVLVAALGTVAWAMWIIRHPPRPAVSAPRFALAMPTPAPACPDVSLDMQQCQSVAFSMTAIAKAQKERIAVLEAEIAAMKAANPANPPVTYKRKRKEVLTSARDEMQKALAR